MSDEVKYPSVVTGRELLSIFESLNTGAGGEDRVERVIQEVGGSWALARIPLDLINFSEASVEAPSSQKLIKRYGKMKTDMPPVILDSFSHGEKEYEILDGFHRVMVAQKRGDKDILAYVPAGSSVEAEINDDWKDAGIKIRKIESNGEYHRLGAYDGKELIAEFSFTEESDKLYPEGLTVNPNYRRMGLATALYVFAEEEYGKTIVPAAGNSPDAKKFWRQKDRPFGSVIAAGDPELPVDKLRRVLPLVNAKMPPGMQLVAQAGGDLFAVDLVGNGVRSGSFTFFSTLGDMEWFTRLFGAVPFTPGSGMVYVTYRDDRSGVEEPAGLLNMGDADEVWAARLMTILGAPAAPPEAEPVIPQRDPPIINMKPMPIEKSFWFQQDGAQRLEQSIVYPKFKLPDSLWPVGWQPGDPVQAVTAKAKSYPESIMPTERNDFALDDAKRLGITRYEAKALRADSFQAFQELLNVILVEQQLEEPYRKTVAGLLNRSRKAKGYEAL